MATQDEVIQLNESYSPPDGYDTVVIEGTGDEGGLEEETFPDISISLNKNSITSNGVDTVEITVKVTDYDDPEFYIPTEEEEVVSSSSSESLSVSKYIIGTPRVYEWDGETAQGDPIRGVEIPLADYSADNPRPYFRSTIRFRTERVSGDNVKYVVDYTGVATCSFNVGYENEVWYPIEEFPEVDPTWEPDDEEDVGGTILPSLAVFENSRTADAGYEDYFTESGKIEFMPTAGDYGTAYINVNYNGYTIYATIEVQQGLLGDNASLTLTAEPTAINIDGVSLVTLIAVPEGETDPNGLEAVFALYNSPSPPDYGDGSFSVKQVVLSSVEYQDEDITSSDDLTFSLPGVIDSIESIELHPDTAEDFEWTWDGLGTIDGTTFHLSSGEVIEEGVEPAPANPLPLDATPLLISYTIKGVAQTNFTGEEYGECIIVGSINDNNATTTISVEAVEGSAFSLEVEPTELNFNDVSEVVVVVPSPTDTVSYALVTSGTAAAEELEGGGSKGILDIDSSPAREQVDEDVTPTDTRTFSLSYLPISEGDYESGLDAPVVTSLETGETLEVESIEESTVTLVDALTIENFGDLNVVYITNTIIRGTYTAPNNLMVVNLNAQLDSTEEILTEKLMTGIICNDWQIDLYNSTPVDILGLTGEAVAHWHEEDETGVDISDVIRVFGVLTEPDPLYVPVEGVDETWEDRIGVPNMWIKVYVDKNESTYKGTTVDRQLGYATHNDNVTDVTEYPVDTNGNYYLMVQTDAAGKFYFYYHAAETAATNRLSATLVDADAQPLDCGELLETVDIDTQFISSNLDTTEVVLGQVQITFDLAQIPTGSQDKDKALHLAPDDATLSLLGVIDEMDKNGYTDSYPPDIPIEILYIIPNFNDYWVKELKLSGAPGGSSSLVGGSVMFKTIVGKYVETLTSYEDAQNGWTRLAFVPKYQNNQSDFTIVLTAKRATDSSGARIPVAGARIELRGGKTDKYGNSVFYSDADGKTTFYGLEAGETYGINITHENYRANRIEAVGTAEGAGEDEYDDDTINDTFTIPSSGYSTSKYRLQKTSFTLDVIGIVYGTLVGEDITLVEQVGTGDVNDPTDGTEGEPSGENAI